MPWKVIGIVEKQKQFVEQWLSQEWTMTELCARHGVSRQAGYNTVGRYQQAGWKGLDPRSRAPRRHPNQTSAELEQRIVELRREHMRWGPRKLKAVLERRRPQVSWPAASTMGELLRREGLAIARKKRRRVEPYTAPFASASEPNRVWCADFKGWGRTLDGERIDPLTLSDACSRYPIFRSWAHLSRLSALQSVEAIERSSPQTSPLSECLYLDFVPLFLCSEARCRLARQLQSQLLNEQLGV